MEVKYSFVCDGANISKTGNLNALGIFTSISAGSFPCTHPSFTYVACIEFHPVEEGEHKTSLFFVDDDGNSIVPRINGRINISGGNRQANIMLSFNNVTFPKPGRYQIDLSIDNRLVKSDIINLFQSSRPAPPKKD